MKVAYSNLKIFNYKDKLDSLDTQEIKSPIHIRIKPTNICNHRCWYCAYRQDNLQLGKDMVLSDFIPEQKMMEIIDDIVNMKVRAVTFSGGGDPFCYPFLCQAVKQLAKTEIKFAALTNGGRLYGEVANVFAHYATWVRVSMDGWDDESYSYYRNVGYGEYTKVVSNMESFKKLGGNCYLGVSLIIDQTNATHIYESTERLKNIGVDSIKMSPCVTNDIGKDNDTYHLPIFDTVRKQIEMSIDKLASPTFEIYDSYHKLAEKYEKDYTWCPYLQILTVIGADQNIYACQDKAYNKAGLLGSLKEKRFKDVWFESKDKFFKINPSVDCNHHCLSNNKNKLVLEYLNAEHLEFV